MRPDFYFHDMDYNFSYNMIVWETILFTIMPQI